MGRFNASNSSVPKLQATAGIQSDMVSVTATADGTGTGVIPAGASIVGVLSDNQHKIVMLPTYNAGDIIILSVAGQCELQTPIAASVTTINTTDMDDGSAAVKELQLDAGGIYKCVAIGQNPSNNKLQWMVSEFSSNDGTVGTGGTPQDV
ncbi:MAG TPA: hypothetical protein DCM40_32465 [Maribacter sp.]|nr:hypothetical protein [Maribacter sp.]